MARIDVYLRSIEKFGAVGAVLVSGQNVILRFADGDRSANQTVGHDALVVMIREVAPPPALDLIDKGRPARFELASGTTRYAVAVVPKAGVWQIEIGSAAAGAGASAGAAPVVASRRAETPAPQTADASDLILDRGQYDLPDHAALSITTGSAALDDLIAAARGSHATDLYLTASAAPFMRVAGQLTGVPSDRAPLDADQLSRELGIAAPADARAAWQDHGTAVFAYSDAGGRVRVTLTRDQRGPGAALRLLVAEPPTIERLGLDPVGAWLDQRGLIAVAGPSGAGKTTTMAALVRELGERNRRVITIEDPIEIMHSTRAPWISQRAVGEHVVSLAAGVAAAMREGADAIVIGVVHTAEAAAAVVDALAGRHLVLTTVVAPNVSGALHQMLDRLPADQRDHARHVLGEALLGTIGPLIGADGQTQFELLAGTA